MQIESVCVATFPCLHSKCIIQYMHRYIVMEEPVKTNTAQRLHDKNLPCSVCSVCSVHYKYIYTVSCQLDIYRRERLAACRADLEKLI